MINIRRGLFETNSSSMHSICIQRSNNIEFEDIPEKLVIQPGEFGWQCEILLHPHELASYLYSAVLCLCKNKKELSDWKTYIYDTCYNAGCEVEFIEPTVDDYGVENYEINHEYELVDLLNNLRHNKSKLRRFLFGENSFIILANDNDGYEYFKEMEKKLITKKVDVYFKGN